MKYRTTDKHPDLIAGIELTLYGDCSAYRTPSGMRVTVATVENYPDWFEPISERVKVANLEYNPNSWEIVVEFDTDIRPIDKPKLIELIEAALNPNEQREGWTVEEMEREYHDINKGDLAKMNIPNFLEHLSTLKPSGNPEQPPIDALRYTWENMLDWGVHVGKHYTGPDLAPDINERIRHMFRHWGWDIGKKPEETFSRDKMINFTNYILEHIDGAKRGYVGDLNLDKWLETNK